MLGLVAVVSAATCAFLFVVLVRKGLAQAGLWAAPLGALAGIVAAAAVWAVVPGPVKVPLPPELQVPDWVVGRPAELAAVVKALTGVRARTVGITTGLYGAGGFGKTTLAQMVCADPRVRRRFRGRVHLVTVGRDVRGAEAIAARVNDVIKLITGEDATFTNPEDAGRRLGSLLDAGPRRLLALDDVWSPEQLAPFTEGGKACARLVTTRMPELLAGRGKAVQVDQMSPEQARALLTSGLPPLDTAVVQGLLAVTGRWPLLLRLVNKILADYARVDTDASAVSAQGMVLLEKLRAGGPAVVDDLLGEAGRKLNVGKPQERTQAVRATIGASTSKLDRHDAERFHELGVFAEDETVPFRLVAQLWRATAGLDNLQSAQVCKRLAQLALISQAAGPAGGIALHDVVRDFLRAEVGEQRLVGLTGMLLDAIAAALPAASPLDYEAASPVRVAWWEPGHEDRYLWDHLIEHLRGAGRYGEADAVAGDLRWVGARLERFGPAAPAADLSAAGTPRAARLRAVLARAAHLLAPAEPAGAVIDVLHSRVADDPDWGPQVTALRDICPRPRLVNRWPLPDPPDPAHRRVLTGHRVTLFTVAIAPDGRWLAAGSGDRTVRIWDAATDSDDDTVQAWDAATGQARATLTCHDIVSAVAIAPDGSWLATADGGWTVRRWDAATGKELAKLPSRYGGVYAVAIAPDGSWLATAGGDGTVRIWDAATGKERAKLAGQDGAVRAVAIAPDGSWLAAGRIGTVEIWDVVAKQLRATMAGHHGPIFAVAIAPDGGWLTSAGADGTVRIWDAATGEERAKLTGHHGAVSTVAIAPDGSWLATGGSDAMVRIWDAAPTRPTRAALASHRRLVFAIAAAPDGSWLATGGNGGTVRIWDAATAQTQATLPGHHDWVEVVAAAPDGRWLATAGSDGTVRIWDVATWQEQAPLPRQRGTVNAVAVAPGGRWLATGGSDGTVRIWDVVTKQLRATMAGHHGPVFALAVAPNARWLVTAGSRGPVRIWDTATWQERATLPDHRRAVSTVAVAPASRWLATGSDDGTVRIWDTATWQAQALMRVDNRVNACAWLGANALAVGGPAGLYLFDLLTGANPATAGLHAETPPCGG